MNHRLHRLKTKITQIVVIGLLGYWVIGLAGCGYTTRSQIAGPWRTIYVQPFANKIDITDEKADRQRYRTYHPFLESDLTKSVVDRLILDGNLRIVREKDADLVLSGELIDYIRDPVRYDADSEVEEYRITLVVKISLKDTKKNELLWEEDNFMGDTTYFTTGGLAKTEDSALDSAIADLARRIVERTVEGW